MRIINHHILVVSAALLLPTLAARAGAQVAGGSIYGVVQDEQGGLLPGATVTVMGVDRTFHVVTERDGRYRFLNLPPGSYNLSVTLPGFQAFVWESIMVVVGSNVEIPVTLKVAAIEETITVVGESPIVDVKSMGTATNFTQDELARIPNSRDPWALLRTVPGVVMDRVNIAGNETGQQSGFVSKGTRRFDAVWTLDGIVITDMAAVGASPTYFDYDAFDEIQISTSGHDIRQPTGGVGLNMVVKRGTNQFSGTIRGYYTGEGLEWSNVHPEMTARGVTPENADHNVQITDYGADLGGPIFRDRAWVWGSWTKQDIRLFRNATNAPDDTILKNTHIKGNWQASSKDMMSVLWFDGAKEKFGRQTGFAQVEATTATWNQGGLYPDNRPRGLLKFEHNRIFNPSFFLASKFAYYGTGFTLFPIGGLEQQAGHSDRLGQSFGSTVAFNFLRPQTTLVSDGNYFLDAWGASHEIKFGGGYRKADATTQALWPGDMVLALDNSVTDQRARLYREASGTNRTEYFHLYIGDTFTRDRLTVDLGLRWDRQWGSALPSNTQSNRAFPQLVPGIEFEGYRAPFTWNNVSPRAGVTYALDESRNTLLRASFSRYAGQLYAGLVGYMNPTATTVPGFVDYPWVDLNGDHLVQPNEILLDEPIITFGGGFNPAAPTAVTSANRIAPDFKAPITTGGVFGIDRELRPNLAVQLAYTYNRTTNYEMFPWRGNLTAADYAPGPPITGTLRDGTSFSFPTFVPDADRIAAGGNGRILTNYEGFRTTYHGIETSVIKRMSNRWMARLGISYNNAREYYDMNPPVSELGNPTRLDIFPLVQGGQHSQRSTGSGFGDVFMNGKWMMNLNGVYQLPYEIEVAGNLFGRQGAPYPFFQTAALGRDGSQRALVTPELDTVRFENIWNLDLRMAKYHRFDRMSLQLFADLFNVLNSNVELNRERNIASPNFQRLNQTLSPRILRLGVRFGF